MYAFQFSCELVVQSKGEVGCEKAVYKLMVFYGDFSNLIPNPASSSQGFQVKNSVSVNYSKW